MELSRVIYLLIYFLDNCEAAPLESKMKNKKKIQNGRSA